MNANKPVFNYMEFYEYAASYGYPKGLVHIDNYTYIAKLLRATSECVVLDVGCGAGILSRALYSVQHIIGIDINFINLLENGLTKRVQGNGHNLPFVNDAFDRVVFIKTLSLMNASQTLIEAHRVLKKGGLICVCEQLYGVWDIIISKIRKSIKACVNEYLADYGDHQKEKAIDLEQNISLFLEQYGFTDCEVKEVVVKSKYPSFEKIVHRFVYYSPITTIIYKKPHLENRIRSIVADVIDGFLGNIVIITHNYKSVVAKKRLK
jgi:ubiquinone/menaquinone biosynthesis C-methylase UbiE